MKQHEREFFIALIRSGLIIVKNDKKRFKIIPPTFDQILESCEIYDQAYETAIIEGMMTEEENQQWMLETGLWSRNDDKKIEGLKEDIEKLKLEIYNNRSNNNVRETIRAYIRAGEKQLIEQVHKKNQYFQNTCEGYASSEKTSWLIQNTTYYQNKLYDFEDVNLIYFISEWHSSILSDKVIRELSRTEPWKSLWMVRQNSSIKLFNNPENTELNHNQKNIIIWSQMYDSLQESMDCPSKDVIEDDDLLDGWFIHQHKKREKEQAEREFEEQTSNSKIKNAGEIFVMTKSDEQRDKINKLNNPMVQSIKKQREAQIRASKGEVDNSKLSDQQLQLRMQMNNQSRGPSRR